MKDLKIKKYDSAIIGAGISGLSLSHFLSKENKNHCVIESDSKGGGYIKTKITKGYTCELGPNTVLMNNNSIKELIDGLDIKDQILYPKKSFKTKYFLHKNKLIKAPNSLLSFLTSDLLSLRSKINLFFKLFYFVDKNEKTVYDFFNINFGKEFHDNIIEPFLNGIYAGNTRKMILKYSLPKFWKILKKNKNIFSYLIFKKKSKFSRLPFTFKGGYEKLITEIIKKSNGKFLFNHRVCKIEKKNDSFFIIHFTNRNKIYCNKIISTIKLDRFFKIINYKINISKNNYEYNPIDVFHFGIKKNKIKRHYDGFGVLSKRSENKSFLGILFNSNIFPHFSPKNKILMTVLSGGEKQKSLIKIDPKTIKEKIKKELSNIFKIEEFDFINHKRWHKGIPKYNENIIELKKEIKTFERNNKNMFLTGNYIGGISVSDCIHKSKILSKKI